MKRRRGETDDDMTERDRPSTSINEKEKKRPPLPPCLLRPCGLVGIELQGETHDDETTEKRDTARTDEQMRQKTHEHEAKPHDDKTNPR